MKLLVLGGTTFVGPAVAEAALARGWDVTCLHRGRTGGPPDGAESVLGDRTDPDVLGLLAQRGFDAVVDTWSGAPSVARDTARALAAGTGRWAYVSSRSVYAWPLAVGADESAPAAAADPDAGSTDYAADKRGAELAFERELGADRVVHLRAGLVLGPRENVGRLPYWLRTAARGDEFLAPGPADLPLQLIDARDLAGLALRCLDDDRSGPVNAVSPPGFTTTGELIDTCVAVTGGRGLPVWVDGDWLVQQGVQPWTELPVWIPADDEGYALHTADTSRAAQWGLRCRPVTETVVDTWAWVRAVDAGGVTPPPNPRAGQTLAPGREQELLARWAAVPDAG